MTLKHKAFSAVRWTTTAIVLRTLLQIGQLAVLARLLSPEDYGLMAMITVVLSFAGLFSDFGMNSAYVQCQHVTAVQRSSLFWLNVLISCVVTLLVIGLSPLLADFFGFDRLAPLIMLSATTFVLSALGQQVKMTAEKRLHFRPVALIEIFCALLQFIIAALAGLSGWGVYSLVASGVSGAFAGTVLAWFFLANGWRPMWRIKMEDIRPFLGFGGALVANNLIIQINTTIDLFLGGKLLGAASLGFYSIPRNLTFQIQGVVNPIITRIGFPLIAQVQNDIARVRSIYLQTLNMTASTNAPIYIGVAFFAKEIITILLGSGWEQSGDLLRILALWGGLRSTGNPVGSLLLGMGRANLSLKWSLAFLFIIPPTIWIGAQSGVEGMAWTMFGLMVVTFIPLWFFLVRPLCHINLTEYTVSIFKPFVISALAIIPAYWLAIQFEGAFVRLIIGVSIAAPLYLIFSFKGNSEWFMAILQLIGLRKVRD